jgi:formate C-acetyltransferase
VIGGEVIGALPSGRRAGEPLSDGISPTLGSTQEGPTAIVKSVGKVNNPEVFIGQIFNMRIDPNIFKDDEGLKDSQIFRNIVDQKIHRVQFNVVSTNTLKTAQKEPDKHRDLLVRVAGYCAYFVRLPKALQDGIIARTEHRL